MYNLFISNCLFHIFEGWLKTFCFSLNSITVLFLFWGHVVSYVYNVISSSCPVLIWLLWIFFIDVGMRSPQVFSRVRVDQSLLMLEWDHHKFFSKVRVDQSLLIYVMFCILVFVFWSFFLPWCCHFIFELYPFGICCLPFMTASLIWFETIF